MGGWRVPTAGYNQVIFLVLQQKIRPVSNTVFRIMLNCTSLNSMFSIISVILGIFEIH